MTKVRHKTAVLRLGQFLPYRLSVAAHAVSSLIATVYQTQFGLPIPQWRVLSILAEHGSLTQQQLVPLSTMDKQTISRTVRTLCQRGLVARVTSADDRRAFTLSLTAAGRRLHRRLAPTALEYERRLLAGLPASDVPGLQRTLRALEQSARRLASESQAGVNDERT
jgi:DNA-binding MarR family transcriptional regulator